jgi:hypothetical protein
MTAAVVDQAGMSELVPDPEPVLVLEPEPVLVLEPEPVAVPAMEPPAAPAPPAGEPAAAGAEAAPPPESVAEPVPGPAPEAAPPLAAPVVAQIQPVNVSVSVRVDSAGDNGAVTQVNVAAAAPVAGAAEAAQAAQYQDAAPQYQPPIPAGGTVVEEAAQEVAITAPEPAPASASTGLSWNWTWNCGDLPLLGIPIGMAADWNWNWNWNCSDLTQQQQNSEMERDTQYQPTATQYQPVNIHVSIRINSSGNDGPVVQANVAVVVAAPAPSVLPPGPVDASPTPSQPPSQDGHDEGAPAAPVSVTPPPDAAAQTPSGAAEPAVVFDDCCFLPDPRGSAFEAQRPQSVLLRGSAAATQRDITAPARLRASLELTVRLSAGPAVTHVAEAGVSRKPARTVRPNPRRQPFDPLREPVLALGSAGLAPLGAPYGRFGPVVLLLLAIGFAFAAASRTAVRESRTPAAEPGRPPERPG